MLSVHVVWEYERVFVVEWSLARVIFCVGGHHEMKTGLHKVKTVPA